MGKQLQNDLARRFGRGGQPSIWARGPLMTIREAAELGGPRRSMIYSLIRSGQIQTRKVGRRRFIIVTSYLAALGLTSADVSPAAAE